MLADGTTQVISISEGVIQGCNFGTLFFNLGCTLPVKVLKPVKEELRARGLKVAPAFTTILRDLIGEPGPVGEMLTKIMQLGKESQRWSTEMTHSEKELMYQSERTADQAAVNSDVENFLPLHEGTRSLKKTSSAEHP